ncbi:hypothetical protein AAV94_07315 [Lampropedia cohaerens]|uniref:HTH cro/C1-type domain-containing protein n=1 Tax=Lampropedia cohaerens TaxID=1610491 RepID=A0A0U1PZM6_9BURK|nr:helix-turn-helix domain-containing protein [Lampropedia cohaerens]KKW67973.1 hypothetical protein AAV94_07315 [Lampropedia cohaerens]
MSDTNSAAAAGAPLPAQSAAERDPSATPGALLRRYREERGVELRELAAVLKVTPEKLNALEHDAYDKLPDMVFTRALAQSICRLLQVDAAPVLALFPQVGSPRLTRDSDGLNQTFKSTDQPAMAASGYRGGIPRMAWLIGLLLLLAAALVLFWPRMLQMVASSASEAADSPVLASPTQVDGEAEDAPPGLSLVPIPAPSPVPPATTTVDASAAVADVSAPGPVDDTSARAQRDSAAPASPDDTVAATSAQLAADATEPAASEAASAPAEQAAQAAETLRITALEPVWVLVRDASNTILHQSTMPRGRELVITDAPPLRVEIGRADAVQVMVKGERFDIQPFARRNVARFEVSP